MSDKCGFLTLACEESTGNWMRDLLCSSLSKQFVCILSMFWCPVTTFPGKTRINIYSSRQGAYHKQTYESPNSPTWLDLQEYMWRVADGSRSDSKTGVSTKITKAWVIAPQKQTWSLLHCSCLNRLKNVLSRRFSWFEPLLRSWSFVSSSNLDEFCFLLAAVHFWHLFSAVFTVYILLRREEPIESVQLQELLEAILSCWLPVLLSSL